MKTTREQALAALRSDGCDANATPFAPLGIRVAGRGGADRATLTSLADTTMRALR